jgi:ankyrin repeat protein
MVSLLLRLGANVNVKGMVITSNANLLQHNGTPLHIAASQGNREIMSLLLSAGADPKAEDLVLSFPTSYQTEKNAANSRACLARRY